jgi:hypothetical protein
MQCVADNAHSTLKFVDLMKISLPGNGAMFPKNEGENLCRITPSEREVLNLETEACNGNWSSLNSNSLLFT